MTKRLHLHQHPHQHQHQQSLIVSKLVLRFVLPLPELPTHSVPSPAPLPTILLHLLLRPLQQ